jgi:hypothetical protein
MINNSIKMADQNYLLVCCQLGLLEMINNSIKMADQKYLLRDMNGGAEGDGNAVCFITMTAA